MLENVKDHFKKHKTAYIIGGVAVVSVAVGFAVGFSTYRRLDIQAQAKAQVVGLINWKSPAIANAVVVPQGHPGFVIQCNETGEIFMSQNQAAKAMDVNPSTLSGHLNGKYDNAGGNTFTRLGVAQVSE